jgi:hypothetical protein
MTKAPPGTDAPGTFDRAKFLAAVKASWPRYGEAHFQPYALAIGQIALAWNDLHEGLSFLFCRFCGGGFADYHLAVWHSADYDRAKRKMLRGKWRVITDAQAKHFPRLRPDLKWLLDRADELEDARNDAIHSPLTVVGRKIVNGRHEPIMPNVVMKNPRALKLGLSDLEADFQWCHEHILKLRDFVRELDSALSPPSVFPWPDTPQWRKRPPRSPLLAVRRTASCPASTILGVISISGSPARTGPSCSGATT